MPATRVSQILQWARRSLALLLVGLGVVAVIVWVAVLCWLIIEAGKLIV